MHLRPKSLDMSDPAKSAPIAMEQRTSTGERLYSPSSGRNKQAIAGQLATRLPDKACVIEIGSGTGEHGAALCNIRSDIVWMPTDIDAKSRASQDSWGKPFGGRIRPSLALDASQHDWRHRVPKFDTVVCCNVIHIAPWAVALGLAREAGFALAPGGLVILYGPFLEGDETAPSNVAFDNSLKSRNPEWGVRELADVRNQFESQALHLIERIAMPANNLMLVFEKRDA